MAADEHEPQGVVADLVVAFSDAARRGDHLFDMRDDVGLFRYRHSLVAERVTREIHRHACDSRRRIRWHTAHRPGAQRAQHRFLRHVLREREIVHAQHADQGAVQPACLMPEEMLNQLRHRSCCRVRTRVCASASRRS